MLSKLRTILTWTITLLTAALHAQTTIHVPADQPTIQAGINAANTGDTVLVAPGTYFENVLISGKEITLTSSGGSDSTVLDGQEKGSVITVEHTPTMATTISGFTIRNAYSSDSGDAGIYTMYAGVTILNNVFTSNYFGAYITFGSVTFSNNVVFGTNPDQGCFFQNAGIGIFIFGVSAIFDNEGNIAPSWISGNQFVGPGLTDVECPNQGVTVEVGSPLTIQNNSFTNWMSGVGIEPSDYGSVTVAQNLFFNNLQGAVFVDSGLPYPPTDPPYTFIINNTLSNNLLKANGLDGPDYLAEIESEGVYAKLAVENNIISTKSSTNPIFFCEGLPPSPTNGTTPLIVDHNLLWNPVGLLGMGGCPISTGSLGNINSDPNFVSTTNFQLSAGSAAIDAGNNSDVVTSLDYTGGPRVQNGSGALSPIVDMGAYEFSGKASQSYSLLTLMASNYYLTDSNTVTVAATLLTAAQSGSPQPIVSQAITVFENDGNPLSVTTDSVGYATTPTYFLPNAGVYMFTATFPGGGTYSPATSAPLYVFVSKSAAQSATTTNLTCNPTTINIGATSLFSILITSSNGTPTGSITFTDGSTTLGQPTLTNGATTYTYTATTTGTHTITATYAPTGSFAASSATCSITVTGLPTTTTVAVTPKPSTYGQPVIFTTHVAPVTPNKLIPSGQVVLTFCHGATIIVTLDASGNGSLDYPFGTAIAEPVSSCSFTGQYSGDTSFNPSTSASAAFVVNPAPSTTTIVSASPNPASVSQPVVFIIKVTGMPSPTADPITGNPLPPGALQFSGTVQLFDGTTSIASGPVAISGASTGQAVITVATLAVGSHTITATYTNDPNLASSISPSVIEVINPAPPADFTFTGPSTITFRTEATGNGTLTLASLNGFAASIALACNPPLPTHYLCTLAPPTPILPANSTASSTITLQPVLTSAATRHSTRIIFAILFPLALLGFARRRRSRFTPLLTLTLLAILTTTLTACGPDIFYATTPPGTYPITLTATGTPQGSSSPTTHTLSVNIVITP